MATPIQKNSIAKVSPTFSAVLFESQSPIQSVPMLAVSSRPSPSSPPSAAAVSDQSPSAVDRIAAAATSEYTLGRAGKSGPVSASHAARARAIDAAQLPAGRAPERDGRAPERAHADVRI